MENNAYLTGLMRAIGTVFESFSSCPVQCSNFTLVHKTSPEGDISVFIEFIGDMQGGVCMSMDKSIGRQVASDLLGGIEIEEAEANELVTSAVSELGNMIMGNACTNMSAEAFEVDISTPSVFLEGKVPDSYLQQPSYNIPVLLENVGTISFNVLMRPAAYSRLS